MVCHIKRGNENIMLDLCKRRIFRKIKAYYDSILTVKEVQLFILQEYIVSFSQC